MENIQGKMEISDDALSAATGGTSGTFLSLRGQIEQFCTQLRAKTSANPVDQARVAQIQLELISAMGNEPQCGYFLQRAEESAKLLRDEKLKKEVFIKLDKWRSASDM